MSITANIGANHREFHEVKDLNGDGFKDMLTFSEYTNAAGQKTWTAFFEDGATGQTQFQANVIVKEQGGVFKTDLKMDFNHNGLADKYHSEWKIGSSCQPGQGTSNDGFTTNNQDNRFCVPLYATLKLF